MFEIPDDIEERAPAFETPVGPVWSVPAADLGVDRSGDLLVRQLADPVDMISTGAVLKLAANGGGARVHAPSFWTRRDAQLWVAQRRPPGLPLAEVELDRMSWAEAVDVWRPLAEAVAVGHRSGSIHGSIHPWSVWWDAEAGRLCAVDSGCWIGEQIPGNDEWWAPEIRHPSARRQPGPAADVWSLARLLLYLTLPAGEAAAPEPNLSGVPGYSIPGLVKAFHRDPALRLPRVSELIATTSPAPRRTAHVDDIDAGVDVLYGRAQDVERIEHPQFGAGVKFRLTYPEYDEDGFPAGQETTGTFFYSGRGRDIYDSVRHVWEGAELNLLDAAEITNKQGERFFTARAETLPVLEPHWPVTVTNTLKAEGCVSKFFVDTRDQGRPSRALVFGSMLHSMMDTLTQARGDLPTFEEAFDAELPSRRLGMLAAELGDEDIEAFRRDARHHYGNMAGFAAGRDADVKERVGWTGENVEVTRYSTVYGLEGRIDLVTEDPRAGLHIVELKTGSERDEHVSQVRCYRLLWDGVAEERQMRIHGYILYSRSGVMRSAPIDDPLRERRILRARNQLVAAQRSIAEGDPEFSLPYYLMIPEKCHALCRFRKDRCREQTLMLGLGSGATPEAATQAEGGPWRGFPPEVVRRAWTYARHFARLVELENWAQGEQIGRVLQSGRLRERIARHEAIAELSIASIDPAGSEITFGGDVPRIFLPGDTVVAHRGDFHAEHVLRGTVKEVTPTSLRIWTLGAPNAAALPTNDWIVDGLPFRIGHRASYRALYGFLSRRDNRLLQILLRPESKEARRDCAPATDELSVSVETANLLNDQQVKAVHWGLATHGGCLIQGPPGTGKTTVIAHLVRELVSEGKRVIVSAQTNTAVDTMLEALVDVGVRDFLRLGGSDRSPELASALAAAGEDPHQFFSRDVGRSEESLDRLARRLQYTQVIGCTTHRAVRDDVIEFLTIEEDVPFDVAIVDEATQISEPMTLAPLRLAKRFVLVGDHRQLPPIVNNERATTAAVAGYTWFDDEQLAAARDQLGLFAEPATSLPEPVQTPFGLGGLDRSLFERLIEQGLPHVMLEEQYRMHRLIQAYSSEHYYADRLVPHASVADALLELDSTAFGELRDVVQSALEPADPVVFVDVDGTDHGRTNPEEAEAIVETVDAMLRCGVRSERRAIGIVTPFRAQAQLLRKMLAARLEERAKPIQVDTVERYQGSERDTIIVSLVKTEHAGDFLADHRRLNVTITRARRKLIVFGNRECLMMSPMFRSLIEQDETTVVKWT